MWRISVEAKSGDIVFDQNFEVPVFDPLLYPFEVIDAADLESIQPSYHYKGDWRKTGVEHSDNVDGGYYYFPPARHKGMAIMATIMTLVFGSVAIAPIYSDMPIFIAVIFGFFTLILIAWSLSMWLLKSAFDTRPGELIIRRGLFDGKIKQVSAHDIASFELDSTMSSGEIKYYDIVARLKSGKKLKLADHLLGRRDVENLVARIKGELGLPA